VEEDTPAQPTGQGADSKKSAIIEEESSADAQPPASKPKVAIVEEEKGTESPKGPPSPGQIVEEK